MQLIGIHYKNVVRVIVRAANIITLYLDGVNSPRF